MPVAAANGHTAHSPLGGVVGKTDAAIMEEARKRLPVIEAVIDGIGRALTVQRLMQQKLGDQHHSQSAGTSKAARNGMRRCWCLCNAFAIATGEFFAHMLDDLPFARFTFQRSGGIFSELAQRQAAALAASAGPGRNNALDR